MTSRETLANGLHKSKFKIFLTRRVKHVKVLPKKFASQSVQVCRRKRKFVPGVPLFLAHRVEQQSECRDKCQHDGNHCEKRFDWLGPVSVGDSVSLRTHQVPKSCVLLSTFSPHLAGSKDRFEATTKTTSAAIVTTKGGSPATISFSSSFSIA